MHEHELHEVVQRELRPLLGMHHDHDALLDMISDARLVLLGEATHGSHEFYRERAAITKRLIMEKGFDAVAVEADWPDARRVDSWVRGIDGDVTAIESLGDFRRFPTWMWRNLDVVDFLGWLREHNDALPDAERVGFHGMDLYSLFTSIDVVIRQLQVLDPAAAERARQRYACFDHFDIDAQHYGAAAALGISRSCEDEVVAQLLDIQASSLQAEDPDIYLDIEQNARVVVNAERYYRAMFGPRVASWNLRDEHMANTIDQLALHLRARGRSGKLVVWAHNSHLGDARATQMSRRGEWNVGQLLRMRHDDDCRLIGFTTHVGTVTAASDWDAHTERKHVEPSLPGSWEQIFHHAGVPAFSLILRGTPAGEALTESRLERAIGVIYLPETERVSHYFKASLGRQFDAVIHFDTTHAVQPLEGFPLELVHEDLPETYPSTL